MAELAGLVELAKLEEGIDDANAVDDLAMLHVFGKHLLATGTFRTLNHQCIPIRKPAKPMEIGCGKNVRQGGFDHVKCREKLDLATSIGGVHAILASDGDKIFLEYLERQHARRRLLVLVEKFQGPLQLGWIRLVVRIDKNVGVEERPQRATSARRSHPG